MLTFCTCCKGAKTKNEKHFTCTRIAERAHGHSRTLRMGFYRLSSYIYKRYPNHLLAMSGHPHSDVSDAAQHVRAKGHGKTHKICCCIDRFESNICMVPGSSRHVDGEFCKLRHVDCAEQSG